MTISGYIGALEKCLRTIIPAIDGIVQNIKNLSINKKTIELLDDNNELLWELKNIAQYSYLR